MSFPDSHTTRISALFTRIARRYDRMNRLMTFGQDLRWRRLAARQAGLQPGDLVLDLGAGTGDLSLAVKQVQPGAHVISADFNPVMLAGAQGKGIGQLVSADALALPFKAHQFDVLVSGFLVRNVSDLDLALAEMFRALKPGGRLLILDTTRPRRNILLPLIRFYLRVIIPLLGSLVTGDREAYCYLPSSTEGFLSAEELAEELRIAGFNGVRYQRLMFGTVALHWGLRA
ncbi:MAG: ubiquinone/menaquinone biosynthesis methyltransferase [Anaerolineaceae bacterium]|mgnify:CR=1 FL=1|nr:ubiquinone/menaquinone biosynthesis methyltransferase [Anaerolineaceae bacterium]MBN2677948.1 ubiquinone/menaquinone biosynthesis methyltransferase [Anaerolineaceae bacterium]